ncbi:diaminohydroxyphosphoribosylaminopyrimidine deaminase/5-amino-6-(5-phosphoribosylamino)uracil reductase [Sphingomonas vulcanisoli]|uniref:Riboflavin biosynthesis protein RibD n=1 Tax=Sphingomonas vulcanisoli TaxID=1658060 RepID=A0ABX0TWG2_9SPHN|nr:bifunctional diaminohydroxyphosphoribosylaminopyrimidine deaminase/5-amino-6-(5-phosphoribosylamino)uracil reductase RibD [Sphingomonas vulcanisoli]NIJ07946.1 diaminohydroxyphosphoribosylaminopyrimidine deaminase/5-amino-6-(5-phosphoribosylamino)uracil reductase [Sphingomonas vulcanisoli]
MASALAIGERGRGRSTPNPNVGCVIVREGCVVGRGWTQPGGRPHAEAMALEQAGAEVRGSTLYATLEPCAHDSARGPACADLIAAAKPARVVIALSDPDVRTRGRGIERLRAAGIEVLEGVCAAEAGRSMAGWLSRIERGRPYVTLKLATSLDGRIALPDGSSRWITGDAARAHAHLERARCDGILVGRGTWETDVPKLDVRLPGLEDRSSRRILLSSRHPGLVPGSTHPEALEREVRWTPEQARGDVWEVISGVEAIAALPDCNDLLIEGGAQTAASFLAADLVDRLLLYRAPILIGDGKAAIGDIGLTDLAAAHGRWTLIDTRMLGSDRLEVYERARS